MSGSIARRLVVAAIAAILAVAASAPLRAGDVLSFARSLYAHENFWSDITADKETMRLYLDGNLSGLVLENNAKDDFESALEYDPLLQATEWDEVKPRFTVNAENDRTASVTVAVENFGERIFVVLELTMTVDGWRLSDIVASGGTGLVEELRRLNAAS